MQMQMNMGASPQTPVLAALENMGKFMFIKIDEMSLRVTNYGGSGTRPRSPSYLTVIEVVNMNCSNKLLLSRN